MLPASNRGVGGNTCGPDVCNTPTGITGTAPIPYPNVALNAQATPFSTIVRVSYVNALNLGSTIPMSSGDEPGVAHPTVKGSSRNMMGNPKIFIEKLPAINLTCAASSNNMNAASGSTLIPSVTNVFFTDARRAESFAAPSDNPISFSMLEERVGYLRVAHFSLCAPSRAARALALLTERGAEAAVVDLRGNPGGQLKAAVRFAEELLPRGATILMVRERDGDETVYDSRHDGSTELPLWVLVDRMTASAAEVLAASLQWHARATVIGEPTYGKGSGQILRPTPEGLIYADAFRCYLPDGTPIDGRGVQPDLVTAPGDAVRAAVAQARRSFRSR